MIERDWICLDLLKTRGWESRDRDDDVLDSDARFLAWARSQGILSAADARALRRADGKTIWPDDVVASVRDLRLLLHRMFTDVAENRLPRPDDLSALEAVLADAGERRALVRTADGRLAWGWRSTAKVPADLPPDRRAAAAGARILGAVARSAADLLTGGELDRVKVCDAHDCGWFFVDVSRNKSRRWCDMAGCGNRDKARRYRARHA
jgi:predicted RNA-binding Zn ribbon-like protein